MNDVTRYWFRAKRYGWGWGLPLSWQGWVVLFIWISVFFAGARLLRSPHRLAFIGFAVLMVGVLTLICYLKGEPPRWRWGERQ
jgi:CHASE2 domain-containing sensor protein